DRVDPDVVAAEIGREVSDAGLERGLCDPHHVGMRHHPLGAGIGQGQQTAAARHQRYRSPAQIGEREARYLHRAQKIAARGHDVFPGQLVPVGKGDRVDQKVETAPAFLDRREHRVEARLGGHVGFENKIAAEAFRERPHALAQRLALIGEGEPGAVLVQALGDPPGERAIVCDTHDETPFTGHKRHVLPFSVGRNLSRRSSYTKPLVPANQAPCPLLATAFSEYPLHMIDDITETEPLTPFRRWWEAAAAREELAEAMSVATATAGGAPSLRMVLLRGLDEQGFVFYTNFDSRKAAELTENPHAALCFHWKSFARQVRVEGR